MHFQIQGIAHLAPSSGLTQWIVHTTSIAQVVKPTWRSVRMVNISTHPKENVHGRNMCLPNALVSLFQQPQHLKALWVVCQALHNPISQTSLNVMTNETFAVFIQNWGITRWDILSNQALCKLGGQRVTWLEFKPNFATQPGRAALCSQYAPSA